MKAIMFLRPIFTIQTGRNSLRQLNDTIVIFLPRGFEIVTDSGKVQPNPQRCWVQYVSIMKKSPIFIKNYPRIHAYLHLLCTKI